MKIRVIAAGKIKERYLKEAISEYTKRLAGYCDLEIIEVADERIPAKASLANEELIKTKEGRRVLDHVKQRDYVIALDVDRPQMDSVVFASHLSDKMMAGYSTIDFVIGGSLGQSRDVLSRADLRLSFSKMTFPHQLFRVILLEQIYRAFKIINHETYHK